MSDERFEYGFERLRVWQAARNLAGRVYEVTREFAEEEIDGMGGQINQAVLNVCTSLAEGNSRSDKKDKARFSQMAYGSLMEVACLLVLAVDLGALDAEKEEELRREIESVSRQINALRGSQLRDANQQ